MATCLTFKLSAIVSGINILSKTNFILVATVYFYGLRILQIVLKKTNDRLFFEGEG
jgi:hypothetical protein